MDIKHFTIAALVFFSSLFQLNLAASSKIKSDLTLVSKTEILSELTHLPVSDESSHRTYLVRHGESTANVYFEIDGKKMRYVSGRSLDIPLTDIGRKQILKLAEKLSERFPQDARLIITSSAALRTQQTAQIIFEELSKTHSNVILTEEIYEGLNERHLGDWEGKIRDESYVAAESAWREKSAADKFISPEVEGGESHHEVTQRALSALTDIYGRYSELTVIAVTSFNTINATMMKLNHLISSLSHTAGTSLPKVIIENGDLVLLETPKTGTFENTQVISHIKNE